MKNQRKAWLAAGLLALVAAACFSDPTSDLRSGPVAIVTTFTSVSVRAGDSVDVRGVVKDAQGNPLPVGGAQWTSADPTVAVVNLDTIALAPGDIFTRAFIRGVNNQAGVTTVTVTAQGVSATVRVTVLPATFPGVVAVTGTVGPDTIIVNRPAPQTPLVIPYTAGDTLVLNATPTITFSATTSTVTFGAFPGYIIARSATQIKAVSRQAYAGKVTVTNLTYAGDASTGPIAVATIQTDSITIQHGRLKAAPVVATSAFGPNTQMTITANPGTTFNTTSGVTVGSTAAIVLSRTPVGAITSITAIIPANVTGSVMVSNVTSGSATVDSLRAGSLTTVNASFFPGTVTNAPGNLLSTITISGAGAATFTTTGTGASTVTVNGLAAFVVTRTATTITAIAKLPGTAAVSISNVIVAGTTIPSLQTQTPLAVSATTGEANEPGNDASATATALGALNAANDSLVTYAALNGSTDVRDYFSFTMGVTGTVSVRLDFFGNGSGSDDLNPDFDVVVCTTLSGTGACGYAQDIIPGNAGSNVLNPETGTTTSIPAGTTVYVRTYEYFATAGGIGSYRLRVKTP